MFTYFYSDLHTFATNIIPSFLQCRSTPDKLMYQLFVSYNQAAGSGLGNSEVEEPGETRTNDDLTRSAMPLRKPRTSEETVQFVLPSFQRGHALIEVGLQCRYGRSNGPEVQFA